MPIGFSEDKPRLWILGITRTYRVEVRDDGVAIYHPAPFKSVRTYEYDNLGRLSERS